MRTRQTKTQPFVTLLHRLPTRLRLGVPALRGGGHSGWAAWIESTVGAVEGVESVRANPVTGSLLVAHDGAPEREAAIFSVLGAVLPPAPPEPARLLNDLWRIAAALDRRVLRASDGWIDLKTTVPLLVGGVGLVRVLTERPFRPPSSLTMVWWAYVALQRLARAGNDLPDARRSLRSLR